MLQAYEQINKMAQKNIRVAAKEKEKSININVTKIYLQSYGGKGVNGYGDQKTEEKTATQNRDKTQEEEKLYNKTFHIVITEDCCLHKFKLFVTHNSNKALSLDLGFPYMG